MATIIDTVEEDTTDTTADNQTTDQQDNFQIPYDEPEKETQDEDDLPDKYKGKSLKEVAAMHQEAERLVGRQGDEVGQLRKVVDDYIQTEIDKREVTKEPAEEVDFFTDPDKAIESKISNHPAVKQAIEQAERFKQSSRNGLVALSTERICFLKLTISTISELLKKCLVRGKNV